MSVYVDIQLDYDEIVEAMGEADGHLDRMIPQALGLGADMVAAEAREHHDYTDQTGELTNSIQSDGVKGRWQSGNLSATVSAGAAHGIFVEEGTEGHPIGPKYRKALRFPVDGGFAFAKEVWHPGTHAYAFLSDALEKKMPGITEEMEAAVELAFIKAGLG